LKDSIDAREDILGGSITGVRASNESISSITRARKGVSGFSGFMNELLRARRDCVKQGTVSEASNMQHGHTASAKSVCTSHRDLRDRVSWLAESAWAVTMSGQAYSDSCDVQAATSQQPTVSGSLF
jgi:hypothetical protein